MFCAFCVLCSVCAVLCSVCCVLCAVCAVFCVLCSVFCVCCVLCLMCVCVCVRVVCCACVCCAVRVRVLCCVTGRSRRAVRVSRSSGRTPSSAGRPPPAPSSETPSPSRPARDKPTVIRAIFWQHILAVHICCVDCEFTLTGTARQRHCLRREGSGNTRQRQLSHQLHLLPDHLLVLLFPIRHCIARSFSAHSARKAASYAVEAQRKTASCAVGAQQKAAIIHMDRSCEAHLQPRPERRERAGPAPVASSRLPLLADAWLCHSSGWTSRTEGHTTPR